jgi:hypothetical protein
MTFVMRLYAKKLFMQRYTLKKDLGQKKGLDSLSIFLLLEEA